MQYVTSTTTTTTTTSTTVGPLQCHTCSGFCETEEDEGSLELCAADDNACVVEFKLSDDGSSSEVSRKCGAHLSDSNDDIECREQVEEGSWSCSCLLNECNNALETKKMMGYVTSTTTTTTTTTADTTTTTSEESTTTDDDDGYTTYTWITRPTQAGPPPPPPKSYYHLYVFFHYLIRILGFLIFLAGNTRLSLVNTDLNICLRLVKYNSIFLGIFLFLKLLSAHGYLPASAVVPAPAAYHPPPPPVS